jgi:hypothetical protein
VRRGREAPSRPRSPARRLTSRPNVVTGIGVRDPSVGIQRDPRDFTPSRIDAGVEGRGAFTRNRSGRAAAMIVDTCAAPAGADVGSGSGVKKLLRERFNLGTEYDSGSMPPSEPTQKAWSRAVLRSKRRCKMAMR